MRKYLLLFFAMVCVQISAWAAITISSTSVSVGGTTYQGYGIYGAKAGEIAQLLAGTYTGSVQWNGANLNQLKSAEYIKVGDSQNPNVLKDEDLEALQLLSAAKFLDIDGSTLASGANIASIKAGSAIEAVTLPNNLTKKQVNAAGAALKACNANFGSCLSLAAEMGEKDIYVYTHPCTSEKVEYTGTVTGGTGHLDNITCPLTEAGSTFTYINTKFRNELSYGSASEVKGGKIEPNPLKVELTKLTTPQAVYKIEYNGKIITVPNHAVDPNTLMITQEFNSEETGYQNTQGLTGQTVTALTYNYSYTFKKGGWEQTFYIEEAQGDETNGYYAMIENVYANYGNDGYQFDVTSTYNYTYSDPTDNCNEKTVSYTDGPHSTIDIPYNQDVDLETKTITAPVEGGNSTAIAYVNTPGSLYKATSLDKNDCKEADGLVISGNINNGDISVHDGAGDPNGNQNDDDKFVNSATPAFYLDNGSAQIKSIDMSDAEIVDYKYLRVLDAYYTLETIIFPKDCERIPNYCCYANGNSGLPFLKNVTFPENLKEIGDYAFHDTALEELVLPGTIQSVGDYAFYTCKKLEIVEMESLSGTCTFGKYVFASSTVKHVTLSEGVDAIGEHMFDFCASLESIRIPTTAKTIKTGAFAACASLHKLVIPEGVELLEQSVFNGAGLTDIYVMATSAAKVPKIYGLGTDPFDGTVGTFTTKNILGNNTAPNKVKGTDYDETTPMETALSWYQEEFSDMNIGIGGNNCMIQLHYPENMASFYNGTANLPDGWLDNLNNLANRTLAEWEVAKAVDSGWLSTIYAYGSYEYDAENGTHLGGSSKTIGPTEGGLYWPNQQDYYIRLAAGYSSTGEPTAEAWRQIPLQGITDAEEIIYTKKYDDTWYTMAFPWDMDDNTLFSTFNQKCEIVEFVGAEVFDVDNPSTENVKEYSLVFHFEDVAKTRYMPEDHSAEYKRIDSEHTRSVVISANGQQTTKKYYTYEDINTGDWVYWPYHTGNDASADEREMQKKYNAIMHMMVFAGHPYMIHPSIGAKAGQPKDCTVAGVKKIKVGEGETYATLKACAEANKTVKTVSSRTRTRTYNENGTVTDTYSGPEVWTNPETGAGGKYYFIGNINDAVETDGVSDDGAQNMPLPCYFLGVPEGQYYPKYYKKTKGGVGKWSQYSAIIVPDDDALANVEGLNGMTVTSTSGTGLAKGANIEIGAWDFNDMTIVDDISPIIDEALEKDKSAKILHMNVVYNIKGQVVRADSGSVEGLPKGIYIVNGKKYMIK